MKIAIVSFDIKFTENLANLLKNSVKVYGDSLSLIKDTADNKPDVIIYDSSSGIFAEDDLKYLIGKFGLKDIKYYVLKIPENPINPRNFSDDVEFIDKYEALNILPNLLNVKEEPKVESSLVNDVDFEYDNLEFQEIKTENTSNIEPVTFETSLDHDSNTKSEEITNLNFEYQTLEFEPSEKEEEFDLSSTNFEYDNLEFQEIKTENTSNIEPVTFETSLDHDSNTKSEEIAGFDIELNNIDLGSEIELVESDVAQIQTSAAEEKNVLDLEFNNTELESELKQIESEILQPQYSFKEEKFENNQISESNFTFNRKPLEEFVKTETSENIQKEEEKFMVANFNIQISSEDIKKLALEIVRDMVKNDQAMQTIIDHLQIDFQEEARKELDNLKNEIRASLKEEAENVMKAEIERMIKEELKDYVAEITARIVKEKLDQAFKSF